MPWACCIVCSASDLFRPCCPRSDPASNPLEHLRRYQDDQSLHPVLCPQLTDGLKSALGVSGLDAGQGLSKIAGGLSSWWNSLDPVPRPSAQDETAQRVQGSAKVRAADIFRVLVRDKRLRSDLHSGDPTS